MQIKEYISEASIKRIPRYYRCLQEMEEQGKNRTSSKEISKILSLTASQVRQDLCNFGYFGQQGCGYVVTFLKEKINAILGLDKVHNLIIIGGGRIGQALAKYNGFKMEGFNVLAIFDKETSHIEKIEGIEILNVSEIEDYIKRNNIDMAIISTQKEIAKELAEEIVSYGVKSIWNFAPIELDLGENVAIENMNMSESLFMLAYKTKMLEIRSKK